MAHTAKGYYTSLFQVPAERSAKTEDEELVTLGEAMARGESHPVGKMTKKVRAVP
jgi:hypothetical protein